MKINVFKTFLKALKRAFFRYIYCKNDLSYDKKKLHLQQFNFYT